MAVAAGGYGAVVVEQDGTRMYYIKKCERCGHVDNSKTGSDIPGPGSYMSSSFYCPNCRQTQEIRIYGR